MPNFIPDFCQKVINFQRLSKGNQDISKDCSIFIALNSKKSGCLETELSVIFFYLKGFFWEFLE